MALLMLTLGASSSEVSITAQAVEEYKNIPALEGEGRVRYARDDYPGRGQLSGLRGIGRNRRGMANDREP